MKQYQFNVVCHYYHQQIGEQYDLFADMFNDNYAMWLASNDSAWAIFHTSE